MFIPIHSAENSWTNPVEMAPILRGMASWPLGACTSPALKAGLFGRDLS